MPVTNRGVSQLTPDTARAITSPDYLNALPPSLATLQTGLALFALVIIVRFCAISVYTWLRRLRGVDRPNPRAALVLQHRQQPSQRPLWAMDEKDREQGAAVEAEGRYARYEEEQDAMSKKLAVDPSWAGSINGEPRPRPPLVARPPPAPPLTPPELSTAVFTFEDRPRPGDDSFMRQPNPDYMSSTSTAMTPSASTSPSIPRRRSYNRTLPIGVPVPVSQQSSTLSDAADLTFSPSSYPPTSPLLPPAPPSAGAKEIGVQGEIIGVLDGDGAGWTRHTRVYGGGVCLACAASGGNHGGGFYGATVRPEEMR